MKLLNATFMHMGAGGSIYSTYSIWEWKLKYTFE